MNKKYVNRQIRKNRVRAKVSGSALIPRMSVSASLLHIRVQLIDDTKGLTLCESSDLALKEKMTKVQKAEKVGTELAEKAKALKIKEVVFDRGFKLYHGRVKACADAARKAGLTF
jgi:large subunit ribosomal protein L18